MRTQPYDQSALGPHAHAELHQAILNELPIPPRASQVSYDVAVRVRIVWERDGEEWIDTRTTAYTRDAVLVVISDHRWHIVGVWVPPADVRRQ